MGLFSFIKNAGASLFGDKEKEAAKKKLEEEQKLADEMSVLKHLAEQHVANMGLAVTDLNIMINNVPPMEAGAEDSMTAVVTGEAADQETREKVVLTVGNVEGVECVDDQMTTATPPVPPAVFHTVVKGESLSKIAMHYYDGDWKKYTDIFEANEPMLKDPDLIYPGQSLRIPDATTNV
jgi:nucleoid-associated protein YgaU